MRKRKFWKTGVAIAVVLSMQTDVAVYAVNTDGEVQVTQENDITQEDNEAAVIEEKNPETADAEVDSTEENVTECINCRVRYRNASTCSGGKTGRLEEGR